MRLLTHVRFGLSVALAVLVAAAASAQPAEKKLKLKDKTAAKKAADKKAADVEKPSAPLPPITIAPELVERVKPAVAYINGRATSGSGFLVRPDVIATNSHVIRDELMADVKVQFVAAAGAKPLLLTPRLIYENKARDLALLEIEPQTGRPVLDLFRSFNPEGGKPVFVVGNPGQPGGLARVNAVGTGVANDTVMLDNVPFVQLKVSSGPDAIDVGPGTSGGPVFDTTGRVIGVLTRAQVAEKDKLTGRFYAVPAGFVGDALADVAAEPDLAKAARAIDAKHMLDIAIINYYLTGKVAAVILDARETNAKAMTLGNLRKNLQLNDLLTDAFRSFDRTLNDLAEPAYTGALKAQTWPHDLRADLLNMHDNAVKVRQITAAAVLKPADLAKGRHLIEENNAAFRRLRKVSGLTNLVVDEMTETLIAKVNAKIDR